MATDVREADIHEVLEQHHARYEVRPYYVILDQRPAGAPPIEQKVQAGFDVNLYGALEKEQLPLYRSEGARRVVNYFEAVALEIEANAGQHWNIEGTPYTDSLVPATTTHLHPQSILQLPICP